MTSQLVRSTCRFTATVSAPISHFVLHNSRSVDSSLVNSFYNSATRCQTRHASFTFAHFCSSLSPFSARRLSTKASEAENESSSSSSSSSPLPPLSKENDKSAEHEVRIDSQDDNNTVTTSSVMASRSEMLSEFPNEDPIISMESLSEYHVCNVPIRPPLQGLPIRAYFEHTPPANISAVAHGRVTARLSENIYAVQLHDMHLSPIIELGSRVYVEYGKEESSIGTVLGGLVVRVNSNGTFVILLDNNSLDLAVPSEMIKLAEGRAKYINNAAYEQVLEWVRSSGVARHADQESMACVLYERGWRVDKLYLLEGADVHCMTYIPKSVRMCILDKSEWQRDHHRQMRQLLKERVKERDFRYRLTKYSGVVSASMAFLGIAFAFGWNVKNHRRQQRKFQLSLAVKTLYAAQQEYLHHIHTNSATSDTDLTSNNNNNNNSSNSNINANTTEVEVQSSSDKTSLKSNILQRNSANFSSTPTLASSTSSVVKPRKTEESARLPLSPIKSLESMERKLNKMEDYENDEAKNEFGNDKNSDETIYHSSVNSEGKQVSENSINRNDKFSSSTSLTSSSSPLFTNKSNNEADGNKSNLIVNNNNSNNNNNNNKMIENQYNSNEAVEGSSETKSIAKGQTKWYNFLRFSSFTTPHVLADKDDDAENKVLVTREREENAVRQVLRQLDTAHPRVVVLTGYFGCGKSALCRSAIEKEQMPAINVDIRGPEDSLRSVVKALGVENVDVCGDLLDFIAEACQRFTKASGQTPLFVLKLREKSNFKRVYNEAVALACDRRLCHLIIEVPMESLTMANASLPRLDFYTVPNFTRSQAYQYTQHTIDPLSLTVFLDVVGTNSNDLDELFAAVHQRRVSPTEYTNQKLLKAMRQLHNACSEQSQVAEAVSQLARFSFDDGQHVGVDATSLNSASLKNIVLYDPVRDT